MIVHVAGLAVTVDGDRHRQRCAWCGIVLFDHDLSRMAVPDGQDPAPCQWEPGSLVAVDGNVTYVMELDGGERLPPGSCARLPHELTGAVAPADLGAGA